MALVWRRMPALTSQPLITPGAPLRGSVLLGSGPIFPEYALSVVPDSGAAAAV